MRTGLIVLLYHEVNWEDGLFGRGLGNVMSPDLFYENIQYLHKNFSLISLKTALDSYCQGHFQKDHAVTIWFDDGYRGVREYAKQILDAVGITSGVSVCHRFALRQELFYRQKISFIVNSGQLPRLKKYLYPHGYSFYQSLGKFTVDQFSLPVLTIIDQVFEDLTYPELRTDLFRTYLDYHELIDLTKQGWLLFNHSHAHYPLDRLTPAQLQEQINPTSLPDEISRDYLVLPFGIKPDSLLFNDQESQPRLILAGNRINRHPETRELDRILAPMDLTGKQLGQFLQRIAKHVAP